MRAMFFVALAAALQVHSASACSIDELKKIASDPLDRLPSGIMHEPDVNNGEGDVGGMWQMFEGENGTPHSIVLTYLRETGQLKVRMSFLNRRDFVVVATDIRYDEPTFAPNRKEGFKVNPPQYYFFCDNQLVLPPGVSDAAKMTESANIWKKDIAESAGLLKQEFERIPN